MVSRLDLSMLGDLQEEEERRRRLDPIAKAMAGPDVSVADPNRFEAFLQENFAAFSGQQSAQSTPATVPSGGFDIGGLLARAFRRPEPPPDAGLLDRLLPGFRQFATPRIPEGFVTGAPVPLQPAARVVRELSSDLGLATLPLGGSPRVIAGGLLGAAGGATAGQAVGGDVGELIGAVGGGGAGGVPAVQRFAGRGATKLAQSSADLAGGAGRGVVRAGDEIALRAQGRQVAHAATDIPQSSTDAAAQLEREVAAARTRLPQSSAEAAAAKPRFRLTADQLERQVRLRAREPAVNLDREIQQLEAEVIRERVRMGGVRVPPRPPGTPLGNDLLPPRRPDVGLSDDLELPTFERPQQGVMRKWEGARGLEGLAMEEWYTQGVRNLKQARVPVSRESMLPLFRALHGEAPADALSPQLRVVYDDVRQLIRQEETDMLAFLEAAKASDSRTARLDAERFAKAMMAHPDYFPRGWKPPKSAGAEAGTARGRLGATPSFKKPRVEATFSELLEAGYEPASWNPYAMMARRRIAGVEYRESVKLVNRLRQVGKVLPANEAPDGWRVPRVGPVFEGRPFVAAAGEEGQQVMFTPQLAVPGEVASFLERAFGKFPSVDINIAGRDVDLVKSIRFWTNLAKRIKLSASLFQHIDFGFRTVGAAFTPTSIISRAGPLRVPSLVGHLVSSAVSTGARTGLRQQLLSGRALYKNFPISYRDVIREGWGVQGDTSLIRREFLSFIQEQGQKPNLPKQAAQQLVKAQKFFESGLFDGVYRQSQAWALENFIIPQIRRTRPTASIKQVAAEAAEAANVMFSTLGSWQTVIKNPVLREAMENVIFSTNESEALLRGASRALSRPGRPEAGLFREWYLGMFMALATIANVINFAATKRPLPKESYVPIDFDDPYAPWGWGYNNRFLSPQVPFLRGRNDVPVYIDIVGQMDTAFRWGLDPVSALATRFNVIPRAITNQLKGESFGGQPIRGVGERATQLGVDVGLPISGTTLASGAGVIPEQEPRLGRVGQIAQASGVNLRAQTTPDLLDAEAQRRYRKSFADLNDAQKKAVRNSPHIKPELEARSETGRDQMALRIFGKRYDELTDRDKSRVRAALALQSRQTPETQVDVQAQTIPERIRIR